MARRLLLALLVSLVVGACGSAGPSTSADGASGTSPSSPGASPGGTSGTSGSGDPASNGRAYIEALASGNVAGAEAMENPNLRNAAPASKLAPLWSSIVAQFGAYEGIGGVMVADAAPFTNVTVDALFANASLPLIVTLAADGQVAGFHLGSPGPAHSPAAPGEASGAIEPSASPAAYVNRAAFTESAVTVGSAPWTLPGTLSMPVGAGPFPAVVLVAGSGPEDRDETIGPNKPLRDLAWGLASAGIAVLRYDKRTLVYQAQMVALNDITVKQEVTDDATAAIALLHSTPGVAPARVFLAGHSLGGYLAPRIAAGVPGQLAGLAMLEANSTPLPQLLLTQVAYLASLRGSPDPSASAQLDALRAQVALAESPDLSPTTPASQLPLGVPASYWLDLRAYDPLATAAHLSLPMMLTQGGRDYQVPPTELDAWRQALAGKDATFKEYASLDHLLFSGTGQPGPDEYTIPAHVAPDVVADLAAWIRGH